MYSTLVFNPLYNALVYLLGVVPGGDVGLAVVLLTVVLRVVLLPLAQQSQKTQIIMRGLQPKIDAVKKKHPTDLQKQMIETQALYKEAGAHPFAGLLLLFIQIPVLIGLYQVFKYGHLTSPDTALLYAFVHVPSIVSTHFLGMFEVYSRSIVLALIAGATQYVAAQLMPAPAVSDEKSFANDFAKSMQMQVKYVFPVLIFLAAYSISAAIALYFITSNLATIAQEVYNKRTRSSTL